MNNAPTRESRPDGLGERYWNMANDKEKKRLLRNPSLIPSWKKLCKQKMKEDGIAKTSGRMTRTLYKTTVKKMVHERMESSDLVIDGTDDSKKKATIEKDEQGGISKSDIHKFWEIIPNISMQDGFNCLYVALQTFKPFAKFTIQQLRDLVADSIALQVSQGCYKETTIRELHKGKTLKAILDGHRNKAWGTNVCVDALCRSLGEAVIVIQQPCDKKDKKARGAMHYYGPLQNDGSIGTRFKWNGKDDLAYVDSKGKVIMNIGNDHWVALKKRKV
tara:strand:- start:34 stop:858 length:825 start_codon:yes stop_codon:yes gene_type:complete